MVYEKEYADCLEQIDHVVVTCNVWVRMHALCSAIFVKEKFLYFLSVSLRDENHPKRSQPPVERVSQITSEFFP